jgi:hypothetical protein
VEQAAPAENTFDEKWTSVNFVTVEPGSVVTLWVSCHSVKWLVRLVLFIKKQPIFESEYL